MNKWPMIYFLITLDLTACPLNPIDYGNIYNDYWNNELNCIIIQRHVGLGITGAGFLLSNKYVEWQCPTLNTRQENGVKHKADFRSIFQDELHSPRRIKQLFYFQLSHDLFSLFRVITGKQSVTFFPQVIWWQFQHQLAAISLEKY